jgi:hypothetical protein
MVCHADELQANTVAKPHVADRGVSANLSFRNKKAQFRRTTNGLGNLGFQEQAPKADVAYAREILAAVAAPVHPKILTELNSGGMPARGGAGLHQHGWVNHRNCAIRAFGVSGNSDHPSGPKDQRQARGVWKYE